MPVRADSPEGKRLIELHARGENRGYNERFGDRREVMNKQTERDLALTERAVQERKLIHD